MNRKSDFTVDAFHRGGFHLVQPVGKGHRAGLDAMLLAGAVPDGFAGRVADLGAGAGAAGFAVAARCPQAQVLLVEKTEEMAECARKSCDLPQNAALAPRLAVLQADVELAGPERAQAGLDDRSFDFVIMNPPFNAARDRATPDALRREAHVMADGLFERWLRTASAITGPRGEVAIIARPASLGDILAALEGRFGSPRCMPIHPRPEAEAIRILLHARKGARGALALATPLVLHEKDGRAFTARADAVINGRETLFTY
ncbi:methyltransferase [Chelativorans sp. AA-79]|uniref:tRNA1(Val) (adenine(37)-N6)-methyltransferase n=1 Tax=Chelativorans sp. AA-79 TaxID=3028735 RepID=UPI0023F8F69C|nr:methyltransferase [Chelativorans sp. AA-79]WEX08116.1 methyltransferase [Chelativorans sp. AA-79]